MYYVERKYLDMFVLGVRPSGHLRKQDLDVLTHYMRANGMSTEGVVGYLGTLALVTKTLNFCYLTICITNQICRLFYII